MTNRSRIQTWKKHLRLPRLQPTRSTSVAVRASVQATRRPTLATVALTTVLLMDGSLLLRLHCWMRTTLRGKRKPDSRQTLQYSSCLTQPNNNTDSSSSRSSSSRSKPAALAPDLIHRYRMRTALVVVVVMVARTTGMLDTLLLLLLLLLPLLPGRAIAIQVMI